MKGRLIILILATTLACSCRNKQGKTEGAVSADTSKNDAIESAEFDSIAEIYRNLTPPLEIANLFQVMGVPFSPEYLASAINAEEPSTSLKKALYLGILGADLGYLTMYEKTGTSVELISAIKKLADGLNIGQFFDFEAIKRISSDQSMMDSLLFLSINSYKKMDEYLRNNNQSQLSSILIVGVWIEAQYFATQVMKKYPNEKLRERIGEQKYFLNDLIRIVTPYCSFDKEFTTVCNYIRDIAAKYENVKITFTEGHPSSTEKDSILIVTQTETSKAEMTDKVLQEIIETSESVRNKLITN